MTRIVVAPRDEGEITILSELAPGSVEAAALDTVMGRDCPQEADRILIAYARAAVAAVRGICTIAVTDGEDELIVVVASAEGRCDSAVVITPRGAAIRPAGNASSRELEKAR
jgi:hypothetical protein